MQETLQFTCNGLTVRGVLHRPETGAPRAGVLLLHGWGGTRSGPHRILHSAGERLAEKGFASLRFDFRGRGDSDGGVLDHDLNSMIEDAKRAADYARAELELRTLYLVGICSGGEVAVGAMHDGLRVAGAALWSAPVFSAEATLSRRARKSASYLRDYAAKLFRPETWRKLISGRIRFGVIRRVLLGGSVHQKGESERKELSSSEELRGGADSVLLLYGTADPIADEAIDRYTALFGRSGARVSLHRIAGANHGFYSWAWHQEVVERTVAWISAEADTPSP